MSEIVAIDSNIFIWGVRRQASGDQTHMIQKTVDFLNWLDSKKARIIISAPIITEVLSPVTEEKDRKSFMDFIYQNFRIAPLDDIAAEIGAEIWSKNKDFKKFYDIDGNGLRSKFKYDLLVLAIAKAQKVNCLYTEDKGLRNLAIANGLRSEGIPIIAPKTIQSSLIDLIDELSIDINAKEADKE